MTPILLVPYRCSMKRQTKMAQATGTGITESVISHNQKYISAISLSKTERYKLGNLHLFKYLSTDCLAFSEEVTD